VHDINNIFEKTRTAIVNKYQSDNIIFEGRHILVGILMKCCCLQKRALKLQEQRQKEALQRELSREREMQREQQLIHSSTSAAGTSGKTN
jgi:hypothetical protein